VVKAIATNLICLGGTVLFLLHAPARGSLIVTQWSLETGVIGSSGQDGIGSYSVQNPFADVQTASWGPSTARTAFDLSWGSDSGDFLIEASHRAFDIDSGVLRSLSYGGIYITGSTDLLITIDGNYSYSLPVYPMYTVFTAGVSDIQPPHDSPWGEGYSYDTVNGAPASGTFSMSGQAVLPAGHTWSISYSMYVETYYGATGQIAAGDGYVHFTLSEVPEPAAFLLVALGAPLIWRRHTNRPR